MICKKHAYASITFRESSTGTCPMCKLQAEHNKHLQERNLEKVRPRAPSGLPADLDRANKEVEDLRVMRRELGRIIGEGLDLFGPIAFSEILPSVQSLLENHKIAKDMYPDQMKMVSDAAKTIKELQK